MFCGLGLHASVLDETAHCRFRNALVKGGVYDDLLAEVSRPLADHELKLRAAEAAIDATLIESPTRPRTCVDPPQGRAEGDTPDAPDMHSSAGPDARWAKNGSKSTLRFKGFTRADEDGFINRIHTNPANQGESLQFATMPKGAKPPRSHNPHFTQPVCPLPSQRAIMRGSSMLKRSRPAVTQRSLLANQGFDAGE